MGYLPRALTAGVLEKRWDKCPFTGLYLPQQIKADVLDGIAIFFSIGKISTKKRLSIPCAPASEGKKQ